MKRLCDSVLAFLDLRDCCRKLARSLTSFLRIGMAAEIAVGSWVGRKATQVRRRFSSGTGRYEKNKLALEEQQLKTVRTLLALNAPVLHFSARVLIQPMNR